MFTRDPNPRQGSAKADQRLQQRATVQQPAWFCFLGDKSHPFHRQRIFLQTKLGSPVTGTREPSFRLSLAQKKSSVPHLASKQSIVGFTEEPVSSSSAPKSRFGFIPGSASYQLCTIRNPTHLRACSPIRQMDAVYLPISTG